jgi:hypothetical protein
VIHDLGRWADEIGRAYAEIAMVLRFEVPADPDTLHICFVMKDGVKVPWFAEGKGIDGLAYATVPGRDTKDRILTDARCRLPGLRLYMSLCDARAIMYSYRDGQERLAGEELLGARYRVLYPEGSELPPLEEFFYLWGEASVADPT